MRAFLRGFWRGYCDAAGSRLAIDAWLVVGSINLTAAVVLHRWWLAVANAIMLVLWLRLSRARTRVREGGKYGW